MTKIQFFWKYYKAELFITIVVFALAIFWVVQTNQQDLPFSRFIQDLDAWYAKWFDPILTVGTFLLAIFVWANARLKDWESSLDNHLTVHFKAGEHFVLSYYNARMVGEHDIRAFAQQLGRQMNDNDNLAFIPGLKAKPVEVVFTQNKKYIRYHEIEMQLRYIPKKFQNRYVYWRFLGEKERETRRQKITNRLKGLSIAQKWEAINLDKGVEPGDYPLRPFQFDKKMA